MPRCPNCNYILVLLEKRRKYKCAKCSRLFPQKEIDSKEFKDYNKKEREKGKKEIKKERNKAWRLQNPEKFKEIVRRSYKKRKINGLIERHKDNKKLREYAKTHYRENRELILTKQRVYKDKNRDKINTRRRELYQLNKIRINSRKKELRLLNQERTKIMFRMAFWRQEQKKLALQMLENKLYTAYTNVLDV